MWALGATIIWVLIALFVPASGPHSRGVAVRMHTKAAIKDLQIALLNFHTEYGRWPFDLENLDEENPVQLHAGIIRTLLSEEGQFTLEDNPRSIRFIDLPLARDDLGGLVLEGEEIVGMVDAWGTAYFVAVDLGEDKLIPNPEALVPSSQRGDKDAPSELPVPVLIFSAGPDKDPNTWKDNITSWRH